MCTFMIIFRLVLLRMITISDKLQEKKQNTFYVQYFVFENRTAINEIMRENMVQSYGTLMTTKSGAYRTDLLAG